MEASASDEINSTNAATDVDADAAITPKTKKIKKKGSSIYSRHG